MMRAKRGKHLFARAALSLLCACGAGNPLVAQVDCTSVTRVRSSVTADLATEGWTGVFPFDERFMLRIAVPTLKDTSGGRKITGIRVVYGEGEEVDRTLRKRTIAEDAFIKDTLDNQHVPVDGALARKEVTLMAGPLKPDRMYLFEFTVHTNKDSLPLIRMSGYRPPGGHQPIQCRTGRGARSTLALRGPRQHRARLLAPDQRSTSARRITAERTTSSNA